MNNPCYRRIQTLRLIPQYPAKISVSQLLRQLSSQGFKLDRRSLQRDLNSLSALFSIESDTNKDIPGWYWRKDAEKLELPEMEPSVALSFKMVELFLGQFMPPNALDNLQSYFGQADKLLSTLSDNQLADWPDKIAYLSRNQPLLSPSINREVLSAVYLALLTNSQIDALYEPMHRDAKHYRINPQGIVVVDHVIYLVGTIDDGLKSLQFALHRFISAHNTEIQLKQSHAFSLKRYIEDGHFGYLKPEQPMIKLKLITNDNVANHLSETPLSSDQVIEEKDSEFTVSANVKNTQQLRWWLLSFGHYIEVIEPQFLRKEFAEIASNMNARYVDCY